jgi:hypothetical protein
MRIAIFFAAAIALTLASCGPDSKPAPAPVAEKQKAPKPPDESRRLPKANLVEAKVTDEPLLGKTFMPAGTVAHYKNGKTEYDVFVAKLASPDAAAFLLPDWSKALTNSKSVPSFGGYFGQDGDRPVFVFARGRWIAGICGLPQDDADAVARTLASYLD